MTTYQDSGVDTDKVDVALDRMLKHFKNSYNPRVKIRSGYFANVTDMGNGIGVAMCTDGVGSKTIIADLMHKYDTIGIDCVAMVVNDLICVGATPNSFLDYIAVSKIDVDMLEDIAIGLLRGCNEASIPIVGGELSQLPDIVTGFDLVGMATGLVYPQSINVGKNVCPGDIVIGIESNGLHSNGYSLARKALKSFRLEFQFNELGHSLGEELLMPTHIYVPEILKIINNHYPSALINITGDGLLNLNRIEANVSFIINNLPSIPPIFDIIQTCGNISDAEMFQTFNMGIGFCIVIRPYKVDDTMTILKNFNRNAWIIGEVFGNPKKSIYLTQHGLVGDGKHFRKS